MEYPSCYSIKTPPNINAQELADMVNENYHGWRYDNGYWWGVATWMEEVMNIVL